MADIDLERKKSGSAWGWIMALAILALLGWGVAEAFDGDDLETAEMEMVEPAEEPGAMDEPDAMEGAAAAGAASLGAILDDPQGWIGRTLPDGVYDVDAVPTDRGFWITEGDRRLMVVLVDQPQEEPDDVNTGARVRITDGTLRGPSYLSEIAGVPLDDDTRSLAEGQEVLLVVDEANVEVVQPAGGA